MVVVRLPRVLGAVIAVVLALGIAWYVKTKVADVEKAAGISGTLQPAPTLAPGDAKSLFAADNLAKALATLEDETGATGELAVLKIEPGALKAEAKLADGSYATIQVSADGKSFQVKTPGLAGLDTVPWEEIDAKAPPALVQAAVQQGHTLDEVSYVALIADPIDHSVSWGVYFAGGADHLTGDVHGKLVTPGAGS